MTTISEKKLISQSPYLYLQGAGSDGTDGSSAGVHLRWDFNEELAVNHIPKGNLAAQGTYYTTAGFNKPDDFVKIYRTSYKHNFPIIIDFASMPPSQIIDETYQKAWRYNNMTAVSALPENTCNVVIRFTDIAKYNQAKQQYNPATDRLNFLKNYGGIIEVEVENRFMFSAYAQMQVINEAQENITKIESISSNSKKNPDDEDRLFISSRKKYGADGAFLLKENMDFLLQENGGYLELDRLGIGEKKIMAENIKYIRFRGDNTFPTLLSLETYHDFLLGKNQLSDWQLKAELSLSTDTNEVLRSRLEKANSFQIDKWTKYINGATVNVANYEIRWGDGEDADSLLHGVKEYLRLSKDADNLKANTKPGDFATPDAEYQEEFQISFLDFLKLIAFDFHIARMLGFGYIDADISNNTDQYIYIAVYETTANLYDVQVGSHTFMTLPVGKTDYKLPVTPELTNLKYGWTIDNGTGESVTLTDENGYSKYDKSRAIGLHVKPFDSMLSMGDFFPPDAKEYDYIDYTEPILFGVAYKNNIETGWRRPEISNDPDFQDTQGYNETVAIIRPDIDSDLIYTHLEKEAGIHTYAVYGINWFSRISGLSGSLQTDETIFPVRNSLIPPLNLGVQLIQKEDPLIFTTQAEQKRLNELPAGDKTLVRLTFEWNDIHASNYWYGKKAEFFFRTGALSSISGEIKSVIASGEGLYDIRTKPCTIESIKSTVYPTVPSGEESRFVGSFMTVNDEQNILYEVQAVRQSDVSGEGVIITIKMQENRRLVETDNDDMQYLVKEFAEPPATGHVFSVPENTSIIAGWPIQLAQKIELKNLSEHTEPYTDSEGTTIDIHIGGIYKKANITDIPDVDENGNVIAGSKTGIYRITFKDYSLPPYGDPKIEWYKGSVRVKDEKGEMKVLEVWEIETKADGTLKQPLQLIVCDSTFTNDNDEPAENETETGYTPILTGDDIDVNFHPGYRAYFTHEPGFNESSILPEVGAGTKQTFIACRSTDSDMGFVSPLSTPAVIFAREIIDPIPPEKPEGPLFATRPNFYGKATYTFDTKVRKDSDLDPYALLFYRADEQIILNALYKHETILLIQKALAQIENDKSFTNRWNELVNVEVDASGQFKEWNGYRFPNPDNNNFRVPYSSFNGFNVAKNPGSNEIINGTSGMFGKNVSYKEIVKFAISNAFLPLTEQPVLYKYLDKGYQTSGRKPVIRDSNGDLIMPGPKSTGYDGSPMAVKHPNAKTVRFTDYTLDGASTSFFFYYTKEMSSMLTVSERSEILGPIQLINTAPPKAPEIRKFYTRTENAITGDTTAVLFEINDYQEENIDKILIYRALNANEAKTVRTMQLAAVIDVNETIIDDFSDLNYYPFGEALYYRLAVVRTVKTNGENGIYETEDISSYPSTLILANIIDVNNPPAPELSYTAEENQAEKTLENVVIEWNSTAYNGTYYLYQMNDSGNWTELCSIKTKTGVVQYELPNPLPKTDEDGETIYYRFKVVVENSSGLFSLDEKILTI